MSTETPGTPPEETPGAPPEEAPGAPQETPMTENQAERTMGMLCHLLALAGLVFPFGNIIGPLVIWLMKKDQMPFVDDQGKESLNFEISVSIYGLVAGALSFVVIGIPLLIAVGVFAVVEIILASVKANQGIPFHYPLTIRFIK